MDENKENQNLIVLKQPTPPPTELVSLSNQVVKEIIKPDQSNLPAYVKQELTKRAPELLNALMSGWIKGSSGDRPNPLILRQMGEALGILQGEGSPMVAVNTYVDNSKTINQNNNGPSLDSIIRELDRKKFEKKTDDIIDAELVDPDEG